MIVRDKDFPNNPNLPVIVLSVMLCDKNLNHIDIFPGKVFAVTDCVNNLTLTANDVTALLSVTD